MTGRQLIYGGVRFRFLRSKAGAGYLRFLLLSALLSLATGYGIYELKLASFSESKRDEKLTALGLVDAFVADYAAVRASALNAEAPVSATFRAHAIERFNKAREDGEHLRLLMVGPEGMEIRIPPADAHLAETIRGFMLDPAPKPRTEILEIGGETLLRTVVPSIATEQSCVDCHNQWQAGRITWRRGDVLGALAIDAPMGGFLAQARHQSLGVGLAIFAVLAAIGLYVARLHGGQIREREASEARVRASEARFRDFAEVASDWFWELDERHRFIYFSGQGAPAGGQASQYIGRTPREIVTGLSSEQWAPHEADIAARRPFRAFQFQRRGPDGRLHHLRLAGKPVFDATGTFLGYRGITRDVTVEVASARELEAAVAALREAKELAEQASRAKSEFLATMSHELRTPLNAILGFSEVMIGEIMGPLGTDAYRGYMRDIHSSGAHLLAIINDILDLSKAEAGRLELAEESVDLVDTMRGALRLIAPRAEEAGIALAFAAPGDLPALRADELKLKQIFLNLLSNAVKFTPRGGRVELAAFLDPAGRLVASVRDTGIGIAEADLATAFEPFRQIDNKLSRKYAGTGLGLPLTAAMARLHQAELKLESALGIGTCVTIVFPATRVVATQAAA
jgi:PAS domain S-box-containing protein